MITILGQHFPNYDPKYKNISSKVLLKEVHAILEKEKWQIGNIDIIIILEEPRISPFREKMRDSIAETLNIDNEKINIKATTTEGMGSLGRGEAIAAEAVALIEKG